MASSYSQDMAGTEKQVAVPGMCVFCFDVLYAELFCLDPPRDPQFTNDALCVFPFTFLRASL